MGPAEVSWLTAFLDFPETSYDEGVAFWSAVTGQVVSASRGEHDEFATLLPIGGDDYLRLQRLATGGPRIHLDVHRGDLGVAGARAVSLGATLIHEGDFLTFTSPGGLTFCLVTQPCSVRAQPARWCDHKSLVDQVCLDIPNALFNVETEFWAGLLGLDIWTSKVAQEFKYLPRADSHALRVLMQRRDDDDGPTRAHLDIATDDRAREVDRVKELGATLVRETQWWTTLVDPTGLEFCVTDRNPVTGVLP